jgi:hypothetical protein
MAGAATNDAVEVIGEPSDVPFELLATPVNVDALLKDVKDIARSTADFDTQIGEVRKLYCDRFKHSIIEIVGRDADMALFAIRTAWRAKGSFPDIPVVDLPDRPGWKAAMVAGDDVPGMTPVPLFLFR